MSRPGRKRLERCSEGHLLTDSVRSWKVYTRKDGSTCLLSNGCRHCNNERTAAYKRAVCECGHGKPAHDNGQECFSADIKGWPNCECVRFRAAETLKLKSFPNGGAR